MMQLDKPIVQRTYVTATDAETNKSKTITIYGATPEQVIEHLTKNLRRSKSPATEISTDSPSRRAEKASA